MSALTMSAFGLASGTAPAGAFCARPGRQDSRKVRVIEPSRIHNFKPRTDLVKLMTPPAFKFTLQHLPAPASLAKSVSRRARDHWSRTTPARYAPRRLTHRRRWRPLPGPVTAGYSRRSTPAALARHWRVAHPRRAPPAKSALPPVVRPRDGCQSPPLRKLLRPGVSAHGWKIASPTPWFHLPRHGSAPHG